MLQSYNSGWSIVYFYSSRGKLSNGVLFREEKCNFPNKIILDESLFCQRIPYVHRVIIKNWHCLQRSIREISSFNQRLAIKNIQTSRMWKTKAIFSSNIGNSWQSKSRSTPNLQLQGYHLSSHYERSFAFLVRLSVQPIDRHCTMPVLTLAPLLTSLYPTGQHIVSATCVWLSQFSSLFGLSDKLQLFKAYFSKHNFELIL